MKPKFLQFALPVGMGLMLTTITIFGMLSATLTACSLDEETKHCQNAAYPLWCPSVEVCCTPGHAYYCDGKCYETGCPSTTIQRDFCVVE